MLTAGVQRCKIEKVKMEEKKCLLFSPSIFMESLYLKTVLLLKHCTRKRKRKRQIIKERKEEEKKNK